MLKQQTPNTSEQHEILGHYIDHKLTFREHINSMAEKCTKMIFCYPNRPNLTGDFNMQPSNQYIQEQYYHFFYTGHQYGTKQ